MKCNHCGTEMDEAYVSDSDGYGCGEVKKFVSDVGFVWIGNLLYCPECGNIQANIKITN